jgi:hypothetical protein
MAGKSEWILKLVSARDQLFDVKHARMFYAYPEEDVTPLRSKFLDRLRQACPNVEIHHGLPTMPDLNLTGEHHSLLILDQ